MTRRILHIAFASAALFAATVQASADGPDRNAFLMSTLLGLDTSDLFATGTYTPEGERAALEAIYTDLRTKAGADDIEANDNIVRFAFMGWLAEARNDSALSESYVLDLKALFDKRGDAVMGAVAQAPFLVPNFCATLARFFFHGDNPPAERFNFFMGIEPQMRVLFGPLDGARCTVAYYDVKS